MIYTVCPLDPPCNHSIPKSFGMEVWDSTIKPADRDRYGWDANPWVWAVEFERTEEPDGWRDLAPTNGKPSDVIVTPDWLLNPEEEVLISGNVQSE